MDYLKNHCWCSSSHWDNQHFDCQIIVSLSSYQEGYKEDWGNLTCKVEVFSQERLDDHVKRCREMYPDEDRDWGIDLANKGSGKVTVNKLKPRVLEWLEDNVLDFQGAKGWCVGSDDYGIGESRSGLSIFLQRRSDAMKFIKTWSKWKKPIQYTQYFTDVRKKLDLSTLKYTIN